MLAEKRKQGNWGTHFLFLCSFDINISTHLKTCYILYFSICSESQWGCITEQMSNWSASLIFFSAHPVDPIANNQVTSPLIKWCTKDLSFRLLWGSLHTSTLSFCHHPWWNIDGCYLQRSLLPFCLLVTVPVLFLCGLFSECPQLHSGRALQMHDDPVISVWLLMLRKAFSTKLSFQGDFFQTFSCVSIWTVFEVSVDIYNSTGINHSVKKQWDLLPWLTKEKLPFILHGEQLFLLITKHLGAAVGGVSLQL